MKWFRLYHSILDSISVRKLESSTQLDYFLLLCCASEFRERTGNNTGRTGLTVPDAVWRTRSGTLSGTFPTLVEAGLVALDEDQEVMVLGWEERQFNSDDITARTQKSKHKSSGNVPVGVPGNVRDTDTDTDKTKALSGNPDDVPVVSKKPDRKQQARALIDFLNEKADKHFRYSDVNLNFIVGRLKEGASVEECRAVIARKCRAWKGGEMDYCLRPQTLFNATKFSSYVGEVPPETADAMP